MIERLARNGGAVYLLLAAYFLVNLLVRLSLPASLELDEGQQLFLAQWLATGYDTQPPFYNWLQYGVVQIFGSTVLAVSFLKNLILFCCYLLFGLTASLLIRDRVLAVIATLGLITIPQIGFEAQRDLTHTVAVLFAGCLFVYFFLRTLRHPSALNYALCGIAIGIGVMSKYNFVLLPAAAIIAVLPERDLRARLFDPRILLTIIVSAVLVTPHAIWFMDHVGKATSGSIGKLTEDAHGSRIALIGEGMLSLAGALAVFVLPTLLFFALAFGRTLLRSWKAETRWTRLIGRMFLIIVVVLVLLVVVGGASNIKDRWLVPFFFLLPIYLCAKIEASGETFEGAARRFGVIVIGIMVIVPLVLFARTPLVGAMGRYGKQNVPYGPAIAAILSSGKDRPSMILASDQQMAGNLRQYAVGIPVMVPGYEGFEDSYVFDATHPALFVWRRKGEPVPAMRPDMAAWLARKPELSGAVPEVRYVAEPYYYGRDGDAYQFSYAWVYPVAK
ncbi:ArnT family glycosyltransferase [Mesorhizobium sp. ASY16-5R]|uniref:ArnT family glycosyltransferase n=1 Tax=Mesorhizobium sp. ASY16-5R TaxID=3445772 RepID=UPI003FA03F53